MTPKQNSLYWREWGAAQRYCKAAALPLPDRHALHVRALGRDKSHLHFSNADFDKVLGVFRAIHSPESIGQQLRQIRQPNTRKMGKLRDLYKCLALYIDDPHAYAREIIRDKFSHLASEASGIDDLSDNPPAPDRPSQLDQIIMTLERALNGKQGFRAKAMHSVHDMKIAAGLKCTCASICNPRRPRVVVLDGAEVDQPF